MHGVDWGAFAGAMVVIISAISAATVAIINAVHGVNTSVVTKAAETQAATTKLTTDQTETLKEAISSTNGSGSGGH